VIADYIAKDNPSRAVSFIREIRAQFLLIGRVPLAYQLRPDLGVSAPALVVGNIFLIPGCERSSQD
jgi:toxin ParE1/3/4